MAHFAEIDENNIVLRVVVVDDDVIRDADGRHNELLGQQYCNRILDGKWVQTSYNATFRVRFAGVGYRYDEMRAKLLLIMTMMTELFKHSVNIGIDECNR